MKNLFGALICFVWSGFFLIAGISSVRSGEVQHGHWGMHDGPPVTPTSNPSDYWDSTVLCFVFAAVGFLFGVLFIWAYLRDRA